MASARKDSQELTDFAEELKAWRASRGWTQADLAREVNFSESLIAQVEACNRVPTPDLARELDRVFKTPGFKEARAGVPGTPGTFGRMVARLRGKSFPVSFRSFAPHEKEAADLFVFEHSLIPGPLQAEDYARAILATHPNVTEDQVSERVAARVARQEVLTRDDPPMLWALLDEGVLHRCIGGPKIMYEALIHLVDMARLPNVSVQVIPGMGAHPGLLGACTIAEVNGQPSIVNLEDLADGRVSEDPVTVAEVRLRFKSLQTEALPKAASRDLIMKVAEERWKP